MREDTGMRFARSRGRGAPAREFPGRSAVHGSGRGGGLAAPCGAVAL